MRHGKLEHLALEHVLRHRQRDGDSRLAMLKAQSPVAAKLHIPLEEICGAHPLCRSVQQSFSESPDPPRKRSAAPLPCTMQNSPDCTATRAWMLPQSQKANSIRNLNQNKLRAMSDVATKISPTPDSPAPLTHPPTCPTLHPPTRTANQHMHPLSLKVSGPPPPQRHPHVIPRPFHRFRLPSPTSFPPPQSHPSFVSPFPPCFTAFRPTMPPGPVRLFVPPSVLR